MIHKPTAHVVQVVGVGCRNMLLQLLHNTGGHAGEMGNCSEVTMPGVSTEGRGPAVDSGRQSSGDRL